MPRGKKMSVLLREHRREQRRFRPYQLVAKTHKMYSSIASTYGAFKKRFLQSMKRRFTNALQVVTNVWTAHVTKVLPSIHQTQHRLPMHVDNNTNEKLKDEFAFLDTFFQESFCEYPLSEWSLSEEEMQKIIESINPPEEDTTTMTTTENYHSVDHTIQRPCRLRRKPIRFVAEPAVSTSVRQQSHM